MCFWCFSLRITLKIFKEIKSTHHVIEMSFGDKGIQKKDVCSPGGSLPSLVAPSDPDACGAVLRRQRPRRSVQLIERCCFVPCCVLLLMCFLCFTSVHIVSHRFTDSSDCFTYSFPSLCPSFPSFPVSVYGSCFRCFSPACPFLVVPYFWFVTSCLL